MASGVVATFSLTLLFFLINRLRTRKAQGGRGRDHLHHLHHHRPPNLISDDQRSIGYIAGNMNYNGEIYEPNPYQLWKPPNGCFPRGEAPPPYEEVIGLGAATSCTSVSLGHHRTLPLSICGEVAAAAAGDYQGFLSQVPQAPALSSMPNAAAPTTNLINININNAGTITTVAAGENHVSSGGTGGAPGISTNSYK